MKIIAALSYENAKTVKSPMPNNRGRIIPKPIAIQAVTGLRFIISRRISTRRRTSSLRIFRRGFRDSEMIIALITMMKKPGPVDGMKGPIRIKTPPTVIVTKDWVLNLFTDIRLPPELSSRFHHIHRHRSGSDF